MRLSNHLILCCPLLLLPSILISPPNEKTYKSVLNPYGFRDEINNLFVIVCTTLHSFRDLSENLLSANFHLFKSMCWCSVMSNSLQPHGLCPIRLLCLWNFPGKNCREQGIRKVEKCLQMRLSTRAEHSCKRDVLPRILCSHGKRTFLAHKDVSLIPQKEQTQGQNGF